MTKRLVLGAAMFLLAAGSVSTASAQGAVNPFGRDGVAMSQDFSSERCSAERTVPSRTLLRFTAHCLGVVVSRSSPGRAVLSSIS